MSHTVSTSPPAIWEKQAQRFEKMMRQVLGANAFYRNKYKKGGPSVDQVPSLRDLGQLPFTQKAELDEDQQNSPPFGTNLTFPLADYTRLHQTSGTTGRPIRWLDNPASWQWWLGCWQEIYQAAGVGRQDRIFVAFSFGPFIGFWTAFEAGQQLGAMVLTGGGLSSEQRIESILDNDVTVLVSTPTYALRLAEVAGQLGRDLSGSNVAIGIHAGEPGASIPSVKSKIEAAWGARAVDHAGATEMGAWGFGCGEQNHMHIIENEFVAEVIDPLTLNPATMKDGFQHGELVLTNLGRVGSPLIRYRTGDLVEVSRGPCGCGRATAFLRGGVLGRVDDMLVVRGVNVFPAALENIIREFAEVEEFEVHLRPRHQMAELVIRIEVGRDHEASRLSGELAHRLHNRLGLRAEIEVAESGSLPRYELKSRRFKVYPA